jgi:hypothetical protein
VDEVDYQPDNPAAYVLSRRQRGARVRLFTDVYGNHGAIVSTGWWRRRRVRVAMSYADVSALKVRLRKRAVPAKGRRSGHVNAVPA